MRRSDGCLYDSGLAERGGSIEAFRARVSGRVQGVGFRWYVREAAVRLGIGGWVRNLGDGDVELYARGPAERLRELRRVVRQGPPASRVDRLEVVDRRVDPDAGSEFEVRF